jgi:hypothetical protein
VSESVPERDQRVAAVSCNRRVSQSSESARQNRLGSEPHQTSDQQPDNCYSGLTNYNLLQL